MSNYHADEATLKLLRTGNHESWRNFYDELRTPFRLYFLKFSGMDIKKVNELYQEAMVVFHRNVMSDKLTSPLQSTLRTYLFGIGKILCKKQGENTQNWDSDIPDIPITPQIEIIEDWRDKAEQARNLLNKVGEPCRELLSLIYIKGYVMEAVAEALDLPSTGAVRKRKFDCLKKLRSLL